jgi:hypothetical protein
MPDPFRVKPARIGFKKEFQTRLKLKRGNSDKKAVRVRPTPRCARAVFAGHH